jgi:TetR/AcrR family transcriptional regulator, acrAB operon repressor
MEAAATREALLDAALRVFRERGVARTTLAEIAAAAHVTRGAVYWHFRDKAAVFTAMCDRVQLPMEATLAQVGETRRDDPLGALRDVAVSALTQLATDPGAQAVFDVIFHKCEFAAEFAAVAARQQTTDSDCHRNVERLFRQAVAKRQLPRDTDTRLAAESMNAYMVGLMHQWVQRPDAYDLGRAAAQMIDLFIAGLRAQPPRLPAAAKRAALRSGTIRKSQPQPVRAK